MTKAFKIVSCLNLIYMVVIFFVKYALLFSELQFALFGTLAVILPILLYCFAIFVLLTNKKTKSNNVELLSGIILYVLLIVILLRSLIDQSLVIASFYYPVLLNYYANILVIPTTIYAFYILIVYAEKSR